MPAAREIPPQLSIVVDLPVQYDPDGAILVADWLIAGLQVDHAQATHAERHAGANVGPARIRAAVDHGAAHRLQLRQFHAAVTQADDARNATHRFVTVITPNIERRRR